MSYIVRMKNMTGYNNRQVKTNESLPCNKL